MSCREKPRSLRYFVEYAVLKLWAFPIEIISIVVMARLSGQAHFYPQSSYHNVAYKRNKWRCLHFRPALLAEVKFRRVDKHSMYGKSFQFYWIFEPRKIVLICARTIHSYWK